MHPPVACVAVPVLQCPCCSTFVAVPVLHCLRCSALCCRACFGNRNAPHLTCTPSCLCCIVRAAVPYVEVPVLQCLCCSACVALSALQCPTLTGLFCSACVAVSLLFLPAHIPPLLLQCPPTTTHNSTTFPLPLHMPTH